MSLYDDKIKDLFGEKNYNTILDWCDNNTVDNNSLMELSKLLGERNKVYGKLAQARHSSLRHACRAMFSYWYQLYPREVTLQRLIAALEDENVGLSALAYEISGGAWCSKMAKPTADSGAPINIPYQGSEFNVAHHISSAARKLGMPWADKVDRKGAGERRGLLISNTYSDNNNEMLDTLPGCDDSARAVKDALESLGFQPGKTKINCTIKKDRSKEVLMKDVEKFARSCNQDHVDTLLFYFAGHGGHEALEISDDAAKGEVVVGQDDTEMGDVYNFDALNEAKEGGNFIFGDPDSKDDCGKIFTNHLVSTICKATPNVSHRILMFDCCRGDKSKEMSSPSVNHHKVTIKYSDLQKLQNADYKNTYVFNSTLPHQVAWCSSDGKGLTNFSKYFTKFVGHVDLSCMDVAINAALKHEREGERHVQMVELVKWVDTPFQF